MQVEEIRGTKRPGEAEEQETKIPKTDETSLKLAKIKYRNYNPFPEYGYNSITYDLGFFDPKHYEVPNFASRLAAMAGQTAFAVKDTLNERHRLMLEKRMASAVKGRGKKRGTRELSAKNALAIALDAEKYGLVEARARLKEMSTNLKKTKHAIAGRRKRTAEEKAATYLKQYGVPRTQATSARVRFAAAKHAANVAETVL